MQYQKPALSYEEQADLLLTRGLIADRNLLIERLQVVNYYRLSGYLYPFRQRSDTYKPGTEFNTIWRRYTFDRHLRVLVLEGIERIEVAVRTNLVYHFVHKYGPFGYTYPNNLPKLSDDRYATLLSKIYDMIHPKPPKQSNEIFVKHFREKYGDKHTYPPLWMVVEILSFGSLLTIYRGLGPHIKQQIASTYNVPDNVFNSWMLSLNAVRNICAHHARLWNRELGYKPRIPREPKYPEWNTPERIANNRVFSILTIIKYLMDYIAPQSKWPDRLYSLLNEYPEIPRLSMGFPENWQRYPIWDKK